MVETAIADVVGPAIAADDPHALADEVIGEREQLTSCGAGLAVQRAENLPEPRDARALGIDTRLGVLVGLEDVPDEVRADRRRELRHEPSGLVVLGVEPEAHAQAELRVVLEEGVVPGRAAARGVHRPRGRGQVGAVDRRAARGVGHDHPVAEELGDELEVWSLTAAVAGERELEERLEHLGTLDRVMCDQAPIERWDRLEEFPVRPLDIAMRSSGLEVDGLVLDLGLALGRADVHADAAAGAIVRGHLDGDPVVQQVAGLEFLGLEARRRALDGRGRVDLHPDCGVRADHRALAAVDADRRIPDRELQGDGPLLEPGGARRERPVDREGRDREPVAVASHQHRRDRLDEVRRVGGHDGRKGVAGRGRTERHVAEASDRRVDGRKVLVHDRLAALGVGLLHEGLDALDRLCRRQHAREMEEAGLHDRIDACAHARLGGHGEGVDDPEVDLLVDQVPLDVDRQAIPDLVRPVRRVEEERRAGLGEVEDLDLVEEPELVARDEIRRVDEIGRLRLDGPEAEMRDRGPAGLLGVVHEEALGEEIGAFADDLHGGMVGADGSVRAETEEQGLHLARGARGAVVHVDRQAQVRHVVIDADREVALGAVRRQLVEHGPDHARGHFLGRKTVSAADHAGHRRERGLLGVHPLGERRDHGLVERLPDGAGLLGPVEDGDRRDGLGERGDERIGRERLEEPDHDDTDLLAGGDESIHRLLHRARGGADDHDDAVGVGRAVVVDEAVVAAGVLCELGHHLGHDAGHGVVEQVRGLAGLEERVRVLGRTADEGRVGGHAAGPEGKHVIVADERSDDIVPHDRDLVELMGGAEPVEEVQERDP